MDLSKSKLVVIVPIVVSILAATFGPAAIAIGYAAAQLRCPSCDVAARGILYRAKCPHCDAVINP